MSFLVEKDEGTSGRRTVPFRLYNSDGTGPVTGASNGTMLGSLNGAAQISLGSISAISANAGLYSFALSASNVSTLGSIALYTDAIATSFPQHVATVQVVNFNPFSSQSNVVGVTLANGSYSAVSVRIVAGDYGSINTFGVSNIKAAAYSGVTVDGAKFLSIAGERSAASSWFSSDLGSGRVAQEFLWPLRNRVSISGLTMTVYKPDDTTSAYTMSVTTSANALSGLDGGGRA